MNANQVEISVDDYMADPQFIIETEKNPELHKLIVDEWELDPAIYAILVGHGITVEYLKLSDERALEDVFSVAKWTGHKHALRKKLIQWEESALCPQFPSNTEMPMDVESCVLPGVSEHKLLSTSVTIHLLEDILNRNEKGKIITEHYQMHNKLDSEQRRSLAHTIVDYYIARRRNFPLPDMARFAQLISERFPPEIPEIYYNPRDYKANKKNPSGLIYDRFHNRHKKTLVKNKRVNVLQNLHSKALELSAAEVERLTAFRNWMRNNSEPGEKVFQQWKECFLLRLRSILKDEDVNKQNTIQEWPRLCDKNGYLLVDCDFDILHEGINKTKNLFENWEQFAVHFIKYIQISNIKDHFSLELVMLLDDPNLPLDSRDYIICTVFHAILKPVRASNKKLPTILQAQIDVCRIFDTQQEYKKALCDLREEFTSNNQSLSPRICVIGKPNSFESYFVVTKSLEYQLPSFLRCLDVVLKLKTILGFEYPESCEIFWCFISRFFYNIDYMRKSKNTQLLQLLAYLREHHNELPTVQGTV
ncbi:uncharacterized protein LOC128745332 [Sabethes cyaneus]|uniref:uncharacterized protein LOC128745332 n=1 Tax=Sabethes cyaneus TaxID=53552 RepID=UPI00237E69F5|nr:uncharacterized protein LOC128745332 [Sabethes cyaneus]